MTRLSPVAFALTSAYAASDELHQTFVGGRHGTPVDWLIDTAGALTAALRHPPLRRPESAVAA